MAYDEKTAERVRKLLSGRSEVVEKKMMGGLSFMLNGNMCCSISGRGGLLVRVGADAKDRVLGEPHVEPMVMAGRTMAGFVRVMPDGYRSDSALRAWIERGIDFVSMLPASKPVAKSGAKPSRRPGKQ